jgi:hypothetical protein
MQTGHKESAERHRSQKDDFLMLQKTALELQELTQAYADNFVDNLYLSS